MATVHGPEIRSVQRIQRNWLADGERRILLAMCARMPRWVTPDMLTAIGMVGAAIIMVGYIASNADVRWLWLSLFGYVVQWFGDSTDGNLARYRHIERPRYGYFLDHSCDGLATTLIAVGIGLTAHVTLAIALLALIGYLLMAVHAFLVARVVGELRLSYMNAGPTELRFILIALTLAMMVAPPGMIAASGFTWFDAFVGFIGAFLLTLFVVQTLVTARRLGVEDPTPHH